jgi:phage shock protein C
MERKLYRSRKSRMFLGICGGLGEYYRIDPVNVRVIFVLITVVTSFFPGIIAYFIMAMIIPVEGSRAASPQDTIRENFADMEFSSKNLGEQFKNTYKGNSPPKPSNPPASPQTDSGLSFPPPTRSNRGLYIFAVALVAIGIFLMIVLRFGQIWRFIWPLTLIIAGLIIVILVLTRKKST